MPGVSRLLLLIRGGGRMLRAASSGKVLIRRADVTKSLTALPGVAFVVGNKHGGAEVAEFRL